MAVSVVDGTLLVLATPGDDVISLTLDATQTALQLRVNDELSSYSLAELSAYDIRCRVGNDTVSISDQVLLPGVIRGGPGNDVLTGGGGDETLNAGVGDDVLDGGPGVNVLRGGLGIDTWLIMGSDEADEIEVVSASKTGSCRAGDVLVQEDTFQDLDDAQDRLAINGRAGDDQIVIKGSPAAALFGEEGDDLIYGGSRDDYLDGGPGDDQLFGRGGNDQVYGDRGDDLLRGGPGNDTLFGSGGADVLLPGGGQNSIALSGIANCIEELTYAVSGGFQSSGSEIQVSGSVELTATISPQADGTYSGDVWGGGEGSGSGWVDDQFWTGFGEWWTTSATSSGTLGVQTISGDIEGWGTAFSDEDVVDFSFSGHGGGVARLEQGTVDGSWSVTGDDGFPVSGTWSGKLRITEVQYVAHDVPQTGELSRFQWPADTLPLGIHVTSHIVQQPRPEMHTAILIVPTDQYGNADKYRNDSRFKYDSFTGRYYATIGGYGQIQLNRLVSELNYRTDAPKNNEIEYSVRLGPESSENELIDALFALDRSYKDNLNYDLDPKPKTDGYNSNSYAAGLLWRAGIKIQGIELNAPGWDKQVPGYMFGC